MELFMGLNTSILMIVGLGVVETDICDGWFYI